MSRFAALALLLLLPGRAQAYQREEHYYTVRLALADLSPRLQGDGVAAMCAQLADEARELNAIEVYRALMRHPADYLAWSLSGGGSEAVAGRMATVQQLLHGLTGGSSAGLRTVAVRAVQESRRRVDAAQGPQERADALCALGFALHLYGDSFAHARIRNPARMYDTGIGHFFDASVPDFPLCAPPRRDAWAQYLLGAPALFAGCRRASDLPSLLSSASALTRVAAKSNAFQQPKLRQEEDRALRFLGETAQPIAPSAEARACEAVVAQWASDNRVSPAPSCEGAWRDFYDTATGAFAAYDASPEARTAPGRAPGSRPFSPLSPFAEASR